MTRVSAWRHGGGRSVINSSQFILVTDAQSSMKRLEKKLRNEWKDFCFYSVDTEKVYFKILKTII